MAKHYYFCYCFWYLLIQTFISSSSQFNLMSIDEFSIDNGDIFNLPNSHDHNSKSPSLKFSIHGAQVVSARWRDDSKTERAFQLSDGNLIHFEVKTHNANVTQWKFNWKLAQISQINQTREVCFHYGHNGEYWFGTYQGGNRKWPMDTNRRTSQKQFGIIEFISEIENVLEYLFVNSDEFALLLDEHCPWFIRYDPNEGDPVMCFATNKTAPYDTTNEDPSYLDIKFYIFASSNIRTVTDHVVHRSNLIPKPSKLPLLRNFVYPVFNTFEMEGIGNMSENLYAFADKIMDNGFSNKSEIEIIDYSKHHLSYGIKVNKFDEDNFDMSLIDLHNRGFQITIGARGWVERSKLKTNEYFLNSSEVVDFSDDNACHWYSVLLKKLHFEEKVDSFLMKDFSGVSPPFKNKHTTKYPILFHKSYVECAFKSDVDIKTEMAFRIQHLPVFVEIRNAGSYFGLALQNLIPNALSISIGGYSLISPVLHGQNAEQHIRWVQASALMPRMVFQHYPWLYDNQTLKYVKKFVSLHAQYSDTIIELARKRITTGSPIIRPMWYVAPEDARTYLISDQYMLGDDILVAPILGSGLRERMVYLPSGTWIDQRNGRQYTGPNDIKVSVPLSELAYFKKA